MTKNEFMDILKAETISEFEKRKEDIHKEPKRENGYSGEFNMALNVMAVFEKVATAAMTNALERAGFIKFDD